MEITFDILERVAMALAPHWPFLGVFFGLWLLNRFLETKVFTEARARVPGRFHWFWAWGNDTLVIQPIAQGWLLGLVWVDPEGHGWGPFASANYFATAGVFSMVAWVIGSAIAERKKWKLRFPGDSIPPDGGCDK